MKSKVCQSFQREKEMSLRKVSNSSEQSNAAYLTDIVSDSRFGNNSEIRAKSPQFLMSS
jgi:hypothetical protein